MKAKKRNSPSGHTWVAVVAALVAMAVGLGLGFFAPDLMSPSAQRIADGLSAPLPIPGGARLEKQYGPDGYSGMQNTGKNDSIISYFNWRAGIALDVTGMTKSQVEAIPEFYESYFDKALPGELEGFRWYTSGIEGNAGQGFTKWPQAPDGWSIVAGGAWTWSMMGSIRTRNLLCEVHAEVMDFDHIENSPMWKKNSVLDLNAPAKVQRVMFVTLRVRGEGLRNTKDVKWPPKPDKYAPMTLGYE